MSKFMIGLTIFELIAWLGVGVLQVINVKQGGSCSWLSYFLLYILVVLDRIERLVRYIVDSKNNSNEQNSQ